MLQCNQAPLLTNNISQGPSRKHGAPPCTTTARGESAATTLEQSLQALPRICIACVLHTQRTLGYAPQTVGSVCTHQAPHRRHAQQVVSIALCRSATKRQH